jgi:hypothetical protein
MNSQMYQSGKGGGYLRSPNRAQLIEQGTANIMANLKDYQSKGIGQKNASHEDALHNMLAIYFKGD